MTPLVRAYGDRALLVQLADTSAVLAYVGAVRSELPRGVADVVPAAETVLVVCEDGADVSAVRDVLRRFDLLFEAGRTPSVASQPQAGEVLVPVRYDGPDLADVARHTGLSEDEVVRAHTSATWRVAFCGFVPGFGYLVGDDARLQVPRRDSARTSVPAGSVALAGKYAGVYPRASPGGWQLIGTTDLVLWDLDRDPPALLRPGVRVQFAAQDGP